jgi:hypothetical protein
MCHENIWAAGMPTYKVTGRYAHIRQLHYRPTNRDGTGRGGYTARLRRGRRSAARLGTEGRRDTHKPMRPLCTTGPRQLRQRFNEPAGCTRLADDDDVSAAVPMAIRSPYYAVVCTTPVHPSIVPQVVRVGPEAPQLAHWPVRVVHYVGWLHGR